MTVQALLDWFRAGISPDLALNLFNTGLLLFLLGRSRSRRRVTRQYIIPPTEYQAPQPQPQPTVIHQLKPGSPEWKAAMARKWGQA